MAWINSLNFFVINMYTAVGEGLRLCMYYHIRSQFMTRGIRSSGACSVYILSCGQCSQLMVYKDWEENGFTSVF